MFGVPDITPVVVSRVKPLGNAGFTNHGRHKISVKRSGPQRKVHDRCLYWWIMVAGSARVAGGQWCLNSDGCPDQ